MFIGYLEECLREALDFCFRWRLSAINETLGSFDLYVWSSLSPYDLIYLDLREYVCWPLYLDNDLRVHYRAFYRPMLSIELSSIYLNAFVHFEGYTCVLLLLRFLSVRPLLLDCLIKDRIYMEPNLDCLILVRFGGGFLSSNSTSSAVTCS